LFEEKLVDKSEFPNVRRRLHVNSVQAITTVYRDVL